jgi:hypothetical protein
VDLPLALLGGVLLFGVTAEDEDRVLCHNKGERREGSEIR